MVCYIAHERKMITISCNSILMFEQGYTSMYDNTLTDYQNQTLEDCYSKDALHGMVIHPSSSETSECFTAAAPPLFSL